MILQIHNLCEERECGCKDHEKQSFRRGNRRK